MRNHQVKVRQVSSLKTAKTFLEQVSQEMFDIIILDNNIRTKKDEMPIEQIKEFVESKRPGKTPTYILLCNN